MRVHYKYTGIGQKNENQKLSYPEIRAKKFKFE